MNEDELVKCGTTESESINTDEVFAVLMKNCVVGKETVTFAKDEWDKLQPAMNQLQRQVYEMSLLTPVKSAHGLCKVAACQWSALSELREQAIKDHEKLPKLFRIVETTLTLVDRLVAEKLIAAEGWWIRESADTRRYIEDLKRM